MRREGWRRELRRDVLLHCQSTIKKLMHDFLQQIAHPEDRLLAFLAVTYPLYWQLISGFQLNEIF